MLTQSYLEEEYTNKQKSAKQIAIELNIPIENIYTHLKLFDIPVRKKGPIPLPKLPKVPKLRKDFSARNNEIISLRKQKLTYQQISEKYGITRERVRQILRKVGKDGVIDRSPFIDEKWLREKIKTTKPKDIAKELNLTIWQVSKKLKKLGLKYSSYSEEEKEKLYYLYIVCNKTQKEIGKELNQTQTYISQRLYHYGIITESQRGIRFHNWLGRKKVVEEIL